MKYKFTLLHTIIYYHQETTFNIEIQIFIVIYVIFFITLCSRGEDFQSADNAGEIATAIWDGVFSLSEWHTKITKTTLL